MWLYVAATICTVLGLAGDIIGAVIIARGLFGMTPERVATTEDLRSGQVGLNNPRALEKLQQAADVKRAMRFFVGGFVLQAGGSVVGMVASLMNLDSSAK